MSKTIEGIPEYFTHSQYVEMIRQFGFDPATLSEIRIAPDGVHALVHATDAQGSLIVGRRRYLKHRVYIPVHKDEADTRTARVTPAKEQDL